MSPPTVFQLSNYFVIPISSFIYFSISFSSHTKLSFYTFKKIQICLHMYVLLQKISIAWMIYKDMERHRFASLCVRRPRSSYWQFQFLIIVCFLSFQSISSMSSQPVPWKKSLTNARKLLYQTSVLFKGRLILTG